MGPFLKSMLLAFGIPFMVVIMGITWILGLIWLVWVEAIILFALVLYILSLGGTKPADMVIEVR